MRKVLRGRLLLSLSTIAALGVWAACGGSDGQGVGGEELGVDAGTPDLEKDTSPPPPPPDSGTKDTGASDSGKPKFDAGPPIIIDGGSQFEGGIECFAGGEVEEEPNDQKPIANVLRPIRCGAILVPDAGGGNPDGGESDWLTFEIGDASTGFELYYEGQVHVIVETDGSAPKDISTPGQTLDLKKNQPYYVQIRSNDGKTQFWKVVLKENK